MQQAKGLYSILKKLRHVQKSAEYNDSNRQISLSVPFLNPLHPEQKQSKKASVFVQPKRRNKQKTNKSETSSCYNVNPKVKEVF